MLTIVCACTPYAALRSIHIQPAHSGSNSLLEQCCHRVTSWSCSQWKSVANFQMYLFGLHSFCFQDCSSKEELCVVSPFWMFILVINVKEDLLEVRLSVSSGGDFLSSLTCYQRYLLEELCLPVWNLCFLKGFAVFKIQRISLRRKWK